MTTFKLSSQHPHLRRSGIFTANAGEICAAAWSSNGERFAAGSKNGAITAWNVHTRKITLEAGHHAEVTGVAWHPTKPLLMSSARDKSIRLWQEGHVKATAILRADSEILSLDCHPTPAEQYLVSGGTADSEITLWNARTREVIHRLEGHDSQVTALARSPNGKILASGTGLGTIGLWNESRLSDDLRDHLTGHQRPVRHLTWSPDGKRLASGSDDGMIRIWNPTDRTTIKLLSAHEHEISGLQFTHDGRYLASSSSDDMVVLWRIFDFCRIAEFHTGETRDKPTTSARSGALSLHPQRPLVAIRTTTKTLQAIEVDYDSISKAFDAREVAYVSARVAVLGESERSTEALSLALSQGSNVDDSRMKGRCAFNETVQQSTASQRDTCREIALWSHPAPGKHNTIDRVKFQGTKITIVVIDATRPRDQVIQSAKRLSEHAGLLQGHTRVPTIIIGLSNDDGSSDLKAELTNTANAIECLFLTISDQEELARIRQAIMRSVDWSAIRSVSSVTVFDDLCAFLSNQRSTGTAINRKDALIDQFLNKNRSFLSRKEIKSDLAVALSHACSIGLVCQSPLADIIVLDPDLLMEYSYALAKIAREDAAGMGRVAETEALAGHLEVSERFQELASTDKELLLLAIIWNLLQLEVMFKVHTGEETYFVFPSEVRAESSERASGLERSATLSFDGPSTSIYSSLVVRLAGSLVFSDQQLWNNYSVFKSYDGGLAALRLEAPAGEESTLTIEFDDTIGSISKDVFLDFVKDHLSHRSLAENISAMAEDRAQSVKKSSTKIFIAYHSDDYYNVQHIANELIKRGFRPIMDRGMKPGSRINRRIESSIREADGALYFLGPQGEGGYQGGIELDQLIYQCRDRPDFILVPVWLPGVPPETTEPSLLRDFKPIDCRDLGVDPIAQIELAFRSET